MMECPDEFPSVALETGYGPIVVTFTGHGAQEGWRARAVVGPEGKPAEDHAGAAGLRWRGTEGVGRVFLSTKRSAYATSEEWEVRGNDDLVRRDNGRTVGPATSRAFHNGIVSAVVQYVTEHPDVLPEAKAVQIQQQIARLDAQIRELAGRREALVTERDKALGAAEAARKS